MYIHMSYLDLLFALEYFVFDRSLLRDDCPQLSVSVLYLCQYLTCICVRVKQANRAPARSSKFSIIRCQCFYTFVRVKQVN